MIILLAKRLGQAFLILLGVAAITFVLLYALPADPARMIAGRSATAQTVASIRRELGLGQAQARQVLDQRDHDGEDGGGQHHQSAGALGGRGTKDRGHADSDTTVFRWNVRAARR